MAAETTELTATWLLHECSVCHRVDEWGPLWSWFGSEADLENGNPVLKFCSPACRVKGPSEPAGETFDGVGTIEAVTSYRVLCGGCGRDDSLDAGTRRGAEKEAKDGGWIKHLVGGWLCPKCAAVSALEAEYVKAKGGTP